MAGFADDIRKIIKNQLRFDVMSVLELSDDDSKVTLDDGTGSPLNDVPCLASYKDRHPGDHVTVLKLGSAWCVLGATGKTPADDGPSEDQIRNWIQQGINSANIGPVINVDGGVGAPSGTGWKQASALPYWRDDGNGNRSLWFPQADSGGGSVKPPPPSTHPDPKGVDTADARAYRTNGMQDDTLYSGPATPWGSSARWTTAFFYGNALNAALNAAPVDYVEMTLSRISGPGWNRKVPLRVGLHKARTRVKITNLDRTYIATRLAWNGKDTFRLPASFVSDLKSGAYDGLGLTSSVSGEYLAVTKNSGHLRVVYQ
jgi:hypothetical protein